ncbi:glycosyltransferase family 4 protein [Methylorubrum extorquens]|jgi:glycosyltransferase involved in cell wall biosynthesis
MKIAIFVHCFYPRHIYGTEAYTLVLSKNLKKLGHEVTVVSATFEGEPAQERAVESYIWDGVKVISLDRNHFANKGLSETYYDPSLRGIQERIIRGINPDVIHITHLINHSASVLEVARALKKPIVSTLTDFYGFCFNNKLETAEGGLCHGPNKLRSNCLECYMKDVSSKPWAPEEYGKYADASYRKMASKVFAFRSRVLRDDKIKDFNSITARPNVLNNYYKHISRAIAPSAFLLNAYKDNIRGLKLKLSHFGIDIDRSTKPKRAAGAPIVFGFVGQLAPHKGTHLLIEAFAKLPAGCELYIYGNVEQDKSYIAKLKMLARGHKVHFKGTFSASDTAAVLAELDVMVIPSTWYENSPLILLQSLATHTPTIVSDVAGMTEFVKDGVNGFHFVRGSAKDLEAKLRAFLDDPLLAARMSEATHYDRTALDMAKDVSETYSSIATEALSPSS